MWSLLRNSYAGIGYPREPGYHELQRICIAHGAILQNGMPFTRRIGEHDNPEGWTITEKCADRDCNVAAFRTREDADAFIRSFRRFGN